ncbi:hypothetical protein [Vulcanococcus sp.]|jgi:hypothetical protein|uniref:hypothetical protein n=1 Tax=Vulcanococcus sp. TaxID=2856995 RepID=UPI00322ED831
MVALLLSLLTVVITASQAALSADQPQLIPKEPIQRADQRLRGQGWQPAQGLNPDPLERHLAGNQLASLSACSGTGQGFCRYDYQRGGMSLAVVTIPGPNAEGLVQSWSLR